MRYLLAFVLFIPAICLGQPNMVANGSFEYYTSCPNGGSAIDSAAPWYRFRSSPDYFHSCSSIPAIGVPYNNTGFQYAADGNAYAGFVTLSSTSNEFIAAPITQLMPGNYYEVSMSVNLSDNSGRALDDMGIYFIKSTAAKPNSTTHPNMLSNAKYLSYAQYGIIKDSANWVRLTDTLLADSAYNFIAIGAGPSFSFYTLGYNNPYTGPYYFVDSVVVKDIKGVALNFHDSLLCAGDTFRLPYFVYSTFNSNNIFTVQLSDKNGSFNMPSTIGAYASDTTGSIFCTIPDTISTGTGYRMRIVSSSVADTSNITSFTIDIGNIDSANITTVTNGQLCEGGTLILYANTNVSSTTYMWTGPNNFSSNLSNSGISNVVPANGGDYFITMQFHGCIYRDTLPVQVTAVPAKPVALYNSPACIGQSLDLSATTSTSGVSYSWTGPNSFSSTQQNPSISNITTAVNGSYIVTIDINSCVNSDTVTVSVQPSPAAVVLNNNGPICSGNSLQLNSTSSTSGVTYAWAGPNAFSANTQSSAIANATTVATGWYHMTVDLNGCTYIDSTYAAVHAIPATPTINYNSPLCVGETLNLSTSTVSGAIYTWTGANNFSSSLNNPVRSNMQFADSGVYRLMVTVNGCSSEQDSVAVPLNPTPFVVILATPGDTICVNSPAVFTALPNNHGGTPTYQWYQNNQPVGTGITYSSSALTNGDIIRCEMTESTKCSMPLTDPSNDIKMAVLPWLTPSVVITADPNRPLEEKEYVKFTATTTNAGPVPQYQWKRNNTDVLGATGNIWSANSLSDNDVVSVEIASSYKCPSPANVLSNAITVKVLTSVNDVQGTPALLLYPNPNNGKFILTANGLKKKEVYRITIINEFGQVVYNNPVSLKSNRLYHEINLEHIASGFYLLQLEGEEKVHSLKFVVQ